MLYCQRCGQPTVEQEVDGKTRPVCTACGAVTYLDPKLAVAVVIEREGRFLLGKRGVTTRAAGKWSFPAGFVERGERVEDAAVREAEEEVGLRVSLGPLLGLYSHQGETVVLAAYAGTVAPGEPTANDDLEAVDWFSPDSLPDLAFPHDKRILADWQRWNRSQQLRGRPEVDRRR